jgi:hypothetical protein
MDPTVAKLFAAYEDAFSRLDPERQASFFADVFISAGPKGSTAHSREQFVRFASELAAFYRSIGRTGARIAGIQHVPISDHHVLARVQWSIGFEKLADRAMTAEISYVVDKTDPAHPLIVMSIAHEDEEDALRKAGLIG